MGLEKTLAELLEGQGLARGVTHWTRLPPKPARLVPFPSEVHTELVDALRSLGIEQLYTHQAQAWQAAQKGEHFVVVTPTASGKTLCYNLPVVDALLRQRDGCALYLFPTKALAQDQVAELNALSAHLSQSVGAGVYDGDTPGSARASIRRNARIVISNPDMLHQGILPHHTKWMRFFQNLRFVVLDEMHTYRGVFGSHVGNVLRRLKRVCSFYGASPRFVCCSATIGNPQELATNLVEESVTLIDENGAPRGEKYIVFYNPPLVDAALGLRRGALLESLSFASRFLEDGIQVIVFTRSRQSTEVLLTYLRDTMRKRDVRPDSVRGYRGGYLPRERREIERGLREGEVRGVVSTNALELGIDIGHLDACIMTGYPGTIASTWQQIGRAGRRKAASAGVLVAGAGPLDQYIVRHPAYFFGHSPEQALIHTDNPSVLEEHVRCAAFEIPFRDGELLGRAEATTAVLQALEGQGVLRHAAGTWYWMSEAYPAVEVSLRSGGAGAFTVESREGEQARTIGVVDQHSAPLFLHPGAVYMHEGQQYLVESLDWEGARAAVRPVDVDYYTDASATTSVNVLHVEAEEVEIGRGFGGVRVTSRATGYRRVKMYTHETLGWGEIDLPEQTVETTAYWLAVPPRVADAMQKSGAWDVDPMKDYGPTWQAQRERARQRDGYKCQACSAPEKPGRQHDVHHIVPFREFGYIPGENTNYLQANDLDNLVTLCHNCHVRAEAGRAMRGALHALSYLLRHLAPLYLMTSPHDLGSSTSVRAPGTQQPTIYLYDRFPGGVGFSARLYALHWQMLAAAEDVAQACPCDAGCPSCVGPVDESAGNAKGQALLLVQELRRLKSDADERD